MALQSQLPCLFDLAGGKSKYVGFLISVPSYLTVTLEYFTFLSLTVLLECVTGGWHVGLSSLQLIISLSLQHGDEY